jgi:hypothetical protein
MMELAPKRSQFCFISGVGILDVPKYICAYPSSSHQFLSFAVVVVHIKLPIVFPSSSQCVHTLPRWPLSKHWTLISYMCVCVCVCVCEPKEALLLIHILSANFYFGECPKFQDFLLWWANQNGSLGTIFFKKIKRGKLTNNFGMHLTTIP